MGHLGAALAEEKMSRAAVILELRAILDALPVHPSVAAWQAVADACERARSYAIGRVAGAEEGCKAVGPAGRHCILCRHIGEHIDSRGKRFV